MEIKRRIDGLYRTAHSMETILPVLLGRGADVKQVRWDEADENIQV